MAKYSWLDEKTAASRLLYKDTEHFRQKVKKGELNISYTHINKRKYQYSEKDIESLLDKNAVKINQ
jgi:hypothetical protein